MTKFEQISQQVYQTQADTLKKDFERDFPASGAHKLNPMGIVVDAMHFMSTGEDRTTTATKQHENRLSNLFKDTQSDNRAVEGIAKAVSTGDSVSSVVSNLKLNTTNARAQNEAVNMVYTQFSNKYGADVKGAIGAGVPEPTAIKNFMYNQSKHNLLNIPVELKENGLSTIKKALQGRVPAHQIDSVAMDLLANNFVTKIKGDKVTGYRRKSTVLETASNLTAAHCLIPSNAKECAAKNPDVFTASAAVQVRKYTPNLPHTFSGKEGLADARTKVASALIENYGIDADMANKYSADIVGLTYNQHNGLYTKKGRRPESATTVEQMTQLYGMSLPPKQIRQAESSMSYTDRTKAQQDFLFSVAAKQAPPEANLTSVGGIATTLIKYMPAVTEALMNMVKPPKDNPSEAEVMGYKRATYIHAWNNIWENISKNNSTDFHNILGSWISKVDEDTFMNTKGIVKKYIGAVENTEQRSILTKAFIKKLPNLEGVSFHSGADVNDVDGISEIMGRFKEELNTANYNISHAEVAAGTKVVNGKEEEETDPNVRRNNYHSIVSTLVKEKHKEITTMAHQLKKKGVSVTTAVLGDNPHPLDKLALKYYLTGSTDDFKAMLDRPQRTVAEVIELGTVLAQINSNKEVQVKDAGITKALSPSVTQFNSVSGLAKYKYAKQVIYDAKYMLQDYVAVPTRVEQAGKRHLYKAAIKNGLPKSLATKAFTDPATSDYDHLFTIKVDKGKRIELDEGDATIIDNILNPETELPYGNSGGMGNMLIPLQAIGRWWSDRNHTFAVLEEYYKKQNPKKSLSPKALMMVTPMIDHIRFVVHNGKEAEQFNIPFSYFLTSSFQAKGYKKAPEVAPK